MKLKTLTYVVYNLTYKYYCHTIHGAPCSNKRFSQRESPGLRKRWQKVKKNRRSKYLLSLQAKSNQEQPNGVPYIMIRIRLNQ